MHEETALIAEALVVFGSQKLQHQNDREQWHDASYFCLLSPGNSTCVKGAGCAVFDCWQRRRAHLNDTTVLLTPALNCTTYGKRQESWDKKSYQPNLSLEIRHQ
jgi:hypothetical protein